MPLDRLAFPDPWTAYLREAMADLRPSPVEKPMPLIKKPHKPRSYANWINKVEATHGSTLSKRTVLEEKPKPRVRKKAALTCTPSPYVFPVDPLS